MTLWDKLEKIFRPVVYSYPSPPKDIEMDLVCEECGNNAKDSQTVSDLLLCGPCTEAIERKERFEKEEEEWKDIT